MSVTEPMSKALLAEKLGKRGFTLSARHWKDIDRQLKRGNGFISREAVLMLANQWGWTQPLIRELGRAL